MGRPPGIAVGDPEDRLVKPGGDEGGRCGAPCKPFLSLLPNALFPRQRADTVLLAGLRFPACRPRSWHFCNTGRPIVIVDGAMGHLAVVRGEWLWLHSRYTV